MSEYELSKEEYRGIYPKEHEYQTIDEETLGGIKYLLFYSKYKYYLEKYLNDILKLDELDIKISEIKSDLYKQSLYHRISSLNLNHVFIRNSLNLKGLTNEEVYEFIELVNKNSEEDILNFIKKTYKKVIKFTNDNFDLVLYDPITVSEPIYNNTLVIGISYKLPFPGFLEDKNKKANIELNDEIEKRKKEYAEVTGLPIKIIRYHELYSYNDEYVEEKLEKKYEREKEVYGKK